MTQKSMSYDHAAYIARLSHGFGQNAAGASTNFGKFCAFANLQAYSIVAALAVAGTSTSTLWNGTATVTNINGDSFNLIHVFNANGAAASTATHGPFALAPFNGTLTGTQTSTIGNWVRVQLNGTATTGAAQAGAGNSVDGGIAVNQGDTLHILRGTDATAVIAVALEYGVQALAQITN